MIKWLCVVLATQNTGTSIIKFPECIWWVLIGYFLSIFLFISIHNFIVFSLTFFLLFIFIYFIMFLFYTFLVCIISFYYLIVFILLFIWYKNKEKRDYQFLFIFIFFTLISVISFKYQWEIDKTLKAVPTELKVKTHQ